ncbi:MAG: hypothetical protein ISP45_12175 [Reyranella sp.]|nr:hypothetical protein [Reyranella sp.]
MAQKHRRSNREAKKPKQKKLKAAVSASPLAASPGNPAARAFAGRRK